MDWSRRDVLGSLCASTVAGSIGALGINARAALGDPPNVLFILVDQLRASALSAWGETNIITPNIDEVVANGVKFSLLMNSHAMCTPARTTLVTGLYPRCLGIHNNVQQVPKDVGSIADAFDAQGYRCGWIGKWHLEGKFGVHDDICYVPPGPDRRSFNGYWAAQAANHQYNAAHVYMDNNIEIPPVPADRYGPEFRTDFFYDFLATQPNKTPFFLVMSYGPPHPAPPQFEWAPMVPQEWQDLVDPAALTFRPNVPPTIIEPDPLLTRQDRLGLRGYLHLYYASILSLDALVGDIVQHLKDQGLYENTIIVFSSDHGELAGAHGFYEKAMPFEEANHVPLAISWPSGLTGGTNFTYPLGQADLFATLHGLAGVTPGSHHHGRDLSELLLTGAGTPPQSAYVQGYLDASEMAYYTGGVGVEGPFDLLRTQRWSYVEREIGTPASLFDMVNDPFQLQNLSQHPALTPLIAGMSTVLQLWRNATEDSGQSADTG